MAAFANQCISSGALRRLRSITLTTFPLIYQADWVNHLVHLLSASPLELFHIYSAGAFLDATRTDDFWNQLISTHGKRLRRISMHRMSIYLETIHSICLQCINLEELFLVVGLSDLVRIFISTPCCHSHYKCFTHRMNWGLIYPPRKHWEQYISTLLWLYRTFLQVMYYPSSTSAVQRLLSLDIILQYGRSVQLGEM